MGQAANHYCVFETAGGYCGIAWSSAGITRFQLPTRSADATERLLLRRTQDAEPGTPTQDVASVIEAVKRYFDGVGIDFSGVVREVGPQKPFFECVDAAARKIVWGGTTTYGTLAKALGEGPIEEMPIRAVLRQQAVPLQIYWAP